MPQAAGKARRRDPLRRHHPSHLRAPDRARIYFGVFPTFPLHDLTTWFISNLSKEGNHDMNADYHSCDFSTAREDIGGITAAAWAAADALGLVASAARRFSQGFIHAAQGRSDLAGLDADYDKGRSAFVSA